MPDAQTKLSSADFAAKIKAQYPDYANVPDEELTQRMLTKFPSYRSIVDQTPPSSQPSDSGAVGGALAARAVPVAAEAALEFGTSPTATKTGAAIGRGVGALTSMPTALSGFGDVQKGAYAGSKAGWFTTKLAQDAARPLANALEVLKPYAQAISTVSGAQGVLDLAQMADKTRTDIGTFGFSLDAPRSQQQRDANPALINAVVGKVADLAARLKQNGVEAPVAHAIKLISDGSSTAFGKLMSLYMSAK